MLYSNVFEQIRYQTKMGMPIPIPPFSTATASHNTTLGRVFRPTILTARDYLKQTVNTGCSKHTIKIDGQGDFLADVYKIDTFREASCSEAALGDIIVASHDEDLRETSCGTGATWTTNYGTVSAAFDATTLATSSQLRSLVSVRRGWVYDRDAAGLAIDLDLTIGDLNYRVPLVDAARAGKPGINYYYVDQFGAFVAGPNGHDAAPDATTGLGVAGTAVSASNMIKLFDFFGQWYNQEATFSIGSSKIQDYDYDCAMLMRENFLHTDACQKSWDRAVGQEFVDRQGSRTNVSHSGDAADGIGSGGLALNSIREHRTYACGAQTKREFIEHAQSRLPLMFYHNFHKADALPTALLADLNVQYDFDVLDTKHIYEAVHNDNINILEKVYLYPIDAPGGALIAPAAQTVDHPEIVLQRIIPYLIPGSTVQSAGLRCSDMVYNATFVDQVLHLPIAAKVYFSIIRLWCKHNECFSEDEVPSTSSGVHGGYSRARKCNKDFTLDTISYPAEALWIHERPAKNCDYENGSPDVATRWHVNGHVTVDDVTERVVRLSDSDGLGANRHVRELTGLRARHVDVHHPIIQAASIRVHTAEYMQLFDREHYSINMKYAYTNGDSLYSEERQVPRIFVPFSDKTKAEGANYGVSSVSARQWITVSVEGLTTQFDGDFDRDGLVGGLDYVGASNATLNSRTGKKYTLIQLVFLAWCVNFIMGAEANIALRFRAN